MRTVFALMVAGFLSFVPAALAEVLCAEKSGRVWLRAACKPTERVAVTNNLRCEAPPDKLDTCYTRSTQQVSGNEPLGGAFRNAFASLKCFDTERDFMLSRSVNTPVSDAGPASYGTAAIVRDELILNGSVPVGVRVQTYGQVPGTPTYTLYLTIVCCQR